MSDAAVHSNDLLPTILNLAGANSAPSDGVDLAPHWLSGRPVPKRNLFWRSRSTKAVRSGPWKLVARIADGTKPELYHLTNDPAESDNLAENMPQVTQRLLTAWENWQRDVTTSARPYEQ